MQYAKQFNLAVGVGLTAQQMSELTTDMVWLVNKEVTLPNGQKVTALTPQVYLVARNSDITSRGAVISANEIVGNIGELKNSGVIAGRDLTRINANRIINHGIISSHVISFKSKELLDNIDGLIIAKNQLFINNKGMLSLGNYSEIKVTGNKGILSIVTQEVEDDGTYSITNNDPAFTQILLKNKSIDLNKDNPFRREMDLYDKQILNKVTKGLPEAEKQKYQDAANALIRTSAHLSPDESNYEEIVKSEARGNSDELASYREKLLSESIY